MSAEESEFVWYILAPGQTQTEGPFSLREIDVKFRTNELNSMFHAWKEGMPEWKKIYEIDELKNIIIEGKSEILDEVVQAYVKNLNESGNKKERKKSKVNELDSSESEAEEVAQKEEVKEDDNKDDDLYYYSKPDKSYKVFDPREKKWSAQATKPTEEQIAKLRQIQQELKDEEQRLIDLVRHEIAGEPLSSEVHEPEQPDALAALAAQAVLHTVAQSEEVKEEPVNPMTAEELKQKELKKLKKKRYLENKKRKWYQTKVNNYIYVQGLPDDITEAELKEYFGRCGVIRLDPYSGKDQIKIYKAEEGVPKGDARIGYVNIESVEMAIDMLNEDEIRPGYKIVVQQAEFQQKGGDYVPRQKQKVDKVEQLRIKAEQQRQLAWEDDEHIHDIGLRIIVLEGLYTEEEIQENIDRIDMFLEELEIELRGEIEASIGPIEKMQFFPENPTNGYIKVKFVSALHADECIKVMNGRFFDGRQLKAYFWDGKTDFRIVRETQEELNKRIDDFGQWLEQEEEATGDDSVAK